MEKTRKQNWSKKEELSLISEVDSAGEALRGSGNCGDIKIKKKIMDWNSNKGKF